jgi:hypothetical protein
VDSFRTLLALGPLAVYFLVLGAINLLPRPRVVPAARDTFALGLALAGLITVGPIELLLPRGLLVQMGDRAWLVWATWFCFYGLLVTLAALVQMPRLTIYNISPTELYPRLTAAAQRLDPDARWSADSLVAPRLGVHLHLDDFAALRNVSLSSVGQRQNLAGWRALEEALTEELRPIRAPLNTRGLSLVLTGMLLVTIIAGYWLADPQALTRGMWDMLRQ